MPDRTIAYDVGPLLGPRSGVGNAAEALLTALRALPDPPSLRPYVLSMRATLPPDAIRFPLPAAVAHRLWSHLPWPTADKVLGFPAVIHGTNYLVPPAARAGRLVSVYDAWFLTNPRGVDADVRRAAAVLRRAVRRGATVHCSSSSTAAMVTDLLAPRHVETIPLGHIPLAEPPAAAPEPFAGRLRGRPFVVCVGTVERRKNLPALAHAFGLLAADDPDLMLVVAGRPGNDSGALEAAVASLPSGAATRVVVAGRVDEAAKSWLVHNARTLAYPSFDEGFGFPLLEAMGAGTPVVASNAGSIPEVAGDAALLVDPHDPTALAAALGRVHRDDACRAALVAAGRHRVEAFSWRTTAERIASLYDRLAMEAGW